MATKNEKNTDQNERGDSEPVFSEKNNRKEIIRKYKMFYGMSSTLAQENSKIKDKVSNNSFFIYNSFIDKCM